MEQKGYTAIYCRWFDESSTINLLDELKSVLLELQEEALEWTEQQLMDHIHKYSSAQAPAYFTHHPFTEDAKVWLGALNSLWTAAHLMDGYSYLKGQIDEHTVIFGYRDLIRMFGLIRIMANNQLAPA